MNPVQPLLLEYRGRKPSLGGRAWVAPGACLIGAVTLGEDASVFFNCVLRADINSIRIGRGSNVQDNSTVHVASDRGVEIGEDVSIGHGCIIHACTLGDRILVGMGAILMDGVQVGDDCLIAAGALLPKERIFPARSLILGNPAKVQRGLTDEEVAGLLRLSRKYVGVKDDYRGPG